MSWRPSPEQTAWYNMRARCCNPKNPQFKDYGGRGIGWCPGWDTFAQFLADMGPKPGPGYWLERKDNEQGYSPANCLWATTQDQLNNTRRNHRLTVHGETLTIAQWSRRTGLGAETIRYRVSSGVPPELAVTKPSQRSNT